MDTGEINRLVMNIASHICGIDDEMIYVCWYGNKKSMYFSYGDKAFFILCYEKSKAELFAKLINGEVYDAHGCFRVYFSIKGVFGSLI